MHAIQYVLFQQIIFHVIIVPVVRHANKSIIICVVPDIFRHAARGLRLVDVGVVLVTLTVGLSNDPKS